MRACDTCRLRKTRCDRKEPCSYCIISGFQCSRTQIKSRASRARNRSGKQEQAHLSPPSKLSADTYRIVQPLQSSTAQSSSRQSPYPIKTPSTGSSALSSTPLVDTTSEPSLPKILLVDDSTVDAHQDSAIYGDSSAARNLLAEKLASNSDLRNSPRMIAALNSLRQIVEGDRVNSSDRSQQTTHIHPPSYYDVELPPTDLILDLIRRSKGKQELYILAGPLSFVTREHFTEACKTVFFRTDDYPASTAVLVHGVLDVIFQDYKWHETDPVRRDKHDRWVALCRRNLEIAISNLTVLNVPCTSNVQALLIAACYYMQSAQVSLCKKVAANGCMMVLALGWHRQASMVCDRRQKLVLFWMLYIIDRGLTLRSGYSAIIQDHDIDLPLPWTTPNAPAADMGRIRAWVISNRLLDLVYQKLYSPGALRQSQESRSEAIRDLLSQARSTEPSATRKASLSDTTNGFGEMLDHHHQAVIADLVYLSDEVTYFTLLCMIYRAAPPSAQFGFNPATECIQAARAALDCHRSSIEACKGDPELWNNFLHWTILGTPFVPFTVLFSHVLATQNRPDLERLQLFATLMAASPTSKPAYKVSRLASVFVDVARIYVDLKQQEAAKTMSANYENNVTDTEVMVQEPPLGHTGTQPQTQWKDPAAAGEPIADYSFFDPFFDALGFADQSIDVTSTACTDPWAPDYTDGIESWFTGQQHIMGLLEDDLTYLDT